MDDIVLVKKKNQIYYIQLQLNILHLSHLEINFRLIWRLNLVFQYIHFTVYFSLNYSYTTSGPALSGHNNRWLL